VFLMSDAFRALASGECKVPACDWRSTTILFVSHDWDPARDSAEGLAGRRLARALLEAGARVHVLSARRADDELSFENYNVTAVPSRPFPTNRIGRALNMVRSTVPEAEGAWVADAVTCGIRVLSRLSADTIIYGRAMPGSSNVVAWQLARLTGLPWVAHFSDPWPPHHVLSSGKKWLAPYKWPLFRLWRDRIVRDAGALTLTNPGHSEDVLDGNRIQHLSKTFVVTHLPSQPSASNHPAQYDRFHLVHTGNFYPTAHTSAALMQGLRLFLDRTPAALGRVLFTQAGWAHGDLPAWTAQCDLGSVVRLVDRLGQADVAALLNASTLLLAVDYARPDSRAVLSKIPDYISARRPILAITAPSSSMSRLFNDDGAGLTAHYQSPEQVAQQMGTVFAAWQNHRLDELLPQRTAVESFTPQRVLAELAGAFAIARHRAGPAALVGERSRPLQQMRVGTGPTRQDLKLPLPGR